LHIDSIERTYKELVDIRNKKLKLLKEIEEEKKIRINATDWNNKDNAKFTEDYNENEHIDKLRRAITELTLCNRAEERIETVLKKDISTASIFSKFVSEETDENKKILDKINEVKNSSIFHLDEILDNFFNYETLTKLYKFESMMGISQLAFSMVLQSSLILWCAITLIINIYGEYLLERFKLENRYPKIAWIIKWRQKISKYYILSNFLLIILICLTNIIFGISILSITL